MQRRRSSLIAALTAALALWIGACAGDSGVRVVALTPTPTPTLGASLGNTAGTATPEATLPPSEPVPLPDRPDNPFAGSRDVAGYLAGGLADIEGCLPQLRETWNLTPTRGERCLLVDFDDDGIDEFVYLVSVDGAPPPADIWLFDDANEGFVFLTSIRTLANEVLSSVELMPSVDLSGDGAPEVIVAFERCAGDVCSTDFVVASVDGGLLRDIAPAGAAIESVTSIAFEDANDDGLLDLVIEGGAIETAGAGPPRASVTVLSWDGRDLDVSRTPSEPRYLFHLVADADRAYVSGAFAAASQLYLQAATERLLLDWKVETGKSGGRAELAPYSLFRAALATQRSGDQDSFISLLTQAATQYPSTLHGASAAVYLTVISTGGTPSGACDAAEGLLLQVADTFALIWDYGFANPEHAITGICR
jgi:hypothetical protein